MPTLAPTHPFQNTESLLVVIPDDGIDVEAEARLYDELCDDQVSLPQSTHPKSPQGPPSIFSRDIWLNDNSGTSLTFARNVHIAGWTSVGDKLGGAYVVYDCVIRTKEGTTIHAHKRYNDFAVLHDALKHSLPKHQHHFIPALPPKSPFSRYRAAFLDRRRRQLQYWLSAVLLHPEIGACQAVRWWVMD
ncbi:Phox homologous domain-containing protein [Suillus clintonianus]|uniref:PX domain-containing protein n=1 Tax=Suillus clintonianus TaxID=1904413 RepID=UPI001B8726D9|nr:PX domain-containing protein [Suillus clintonianus]KAG2144535.1 Phox homologous domain-containing protein [Suillus clintonianus]